MPRDAISRGAYVLRESYKDPEPDLLLMGSGSEVHICNAAADLLEAEGIATRVVSAPCLDRFAEQDAGYRDSVLPPSCRARLAVEAAAQLSWWRWVGDAGDVLGMTGARRSAEVVDHDFGTFAGERQRGPPPNAVGAPRDQRYLVFQSHVCPA